MLLLVKMNQAAVARHISAQFLSTSSLCSRRAFRGDESRQLLMFSANPEAMGRAGCRGYRAPVAAYTERSCFVETTFRGKSMVVRVPTSLEEGINLNNARRSSVRAIRREPISQAQRNAELEEEAKKIDLAPHKLLEKGEPGTMQGIIKDVIPVGYFLTLPSGRDGYLPALDLGFTGGIVILERLFKVGQELTVRVVRRGGGGREILSMKKPEFAPNTDPKFIFSERGGFGKSSSMPGNR